MAQEKWLVDAPKTIDVDGARVLKVGLIAGQVDIVAHDEPGIRIEVHSVNGKPLLVKADADTVEIDHPQLRWENFLDVFRNLKPGAGRADVSVMVPRDIRLKLGVVNVAALVSGLHADADLSTVGGDLVVDAVRGDLHLNAVSGEITVRNHAGRITAHTVSGDITAHGDLRSFRSDGVSGDVYLDATGVPDDIRVNTVSGNVTVRLGADVPAAWAFNSVSGWIQAGDAGMRVRGRLIGRRGELERRWADIKANTVSGDVTLLTAETAGATA